jgi:glycosyltransferase involved in cell wall biosynthesis
VAQAIELSVVVPVHDEAGNAGALAREIAAALEGRSFEIIFVDDASKDDTRAELADARREIPALRILVHRRNAGQSRAVRSGVLAARAPVVATLDGDGQNPPGEIPALYQRLVRADAPPGLALVQGKRKKRMDSAAKRFASRVGNGVRKRLLGDGAEDSGCGLKAFYRDAFLKLPFFDHMHRYMPALMQREGYLVEEFDVGHRPRGSGRSKYTNVGRLIAAASDLFGVMWLKSRARSPVAADEL